jgi:hypothetical protein
VRDPALANVPFIRLDAEEVLELCDPNLIINNDNEFALFWRKIKAAIDSN